METKQLELIECTGCHGYFSDLIALDDDAGVCEDCAGKLEAQFDA